MAVRATGHAGLPSPGQRAGVYGEGHAGVAVHQGPAAWSCVSNSQATAPAVAVHRAGQPCGSSIRLENRYVESFNGKLRDELLNVGIFDTLLESQVLVERWRNHYNTEESPISQVRPHSPLGYRPPAPEAIQPWAPGFATLGPTPRAAWTRQSTA